MRSEELRKRITKSSRNSLLATRNFLMPNPSLPHIEKYSQFVNGVGLRIEF